MPFQVDRPEVATNALASAASAAAQQFYSNDQAAVYTTPANASIQRDLTRYALELAHAVAPLATNATGPIMLLDLGAGSGLSTRAASQWLDARGVDAFCVAFDISASMLLLTAATSDDETSATTETIKVLADGRKVITSVDCGTRTAFYCGNAAQKFPLRSRTCDVAIGISMLQWLTDTGLQSCYASLVDVLRSDSAAVFQVYPTSREQVATMETIAMDAGFAYAEVVVAFPHATAGKKWFLVLTKADNPRSSTTLRRDQRDADLCPFGRRHHRRCAWHVLKSSTKINPSLRERLGREHVKEAWHIWRKFHRAAAMAKDAAASGTPLHAKAKRSLALWKSDEVIGEALRDWYVGETEKNADTIEAADTSKHMHEFLLARMDEVVDVVHSAYSKAVALERSLVPPVTS